MAKKFICTKTEPVVQTKAGKLRGFEVDGTYIFQGIKYADAKRFQQPTEPKSWEGVKDALSYGYVCPLMSQDSPSGEVLVPHRYWPQDENCQYLNIWTQSICADAKKPVMVWLHGGGYSAGSSIEQVAYDGENMSRFGDVVVVSLNHRLNILGYLDLSPFGEKYANSANAGNADIVAALKWIRDNIENFGGDPGNVTIFGQSGGGMKVWALLQTPAADGLFQKGIVESGCIKDFFGESNGDGTQIVNGMLKELGFECGDAEKLETVPYAALVNAYAKTAPALMKQGIYTGNAPMENEFYLGDPCKNGFRKETRKIPIIIGSALGEFVFGSCITNKYELSESGIMSMLEKKYGESTEELARLFRAAYPQKSLADLLELDSLFRSPTIDFIQKRSSCKESPVFSYLFGFEFPFDGGTPAWHCSEIPFVFHNTDKVPICNVPGVSDRLEDQMFRAWMSFARNGNPCHPALPEWLPCTPKDEPTMIFDNACEVRHNFDHELIALHEKVSPKFSFNNELILH